MNFHRAHAVLLCAFLASACAAPELAPPPVEEAPPRELSVAEQNDAAFGLFKDLYAFTSERSRQESVPRIIETYEQIIRDYPKAGLAQEAYLKLTLISLEEVSPPDVEKAEQYYRGLVEAYPDSVVRGSMEGALLKHYYKHEQWNKLLSLSGTLVKENMDNPLRGHIMYYAEANFHLGRQQEAIRAYRLLLSKNPTAGETKMANKRLQELEGDSPASASPGQ